MSIAFIGSNNNGAYPVQPPPLPPTPLSGEDLAAMLLNDYLFNNGFPDGLD
jgi:hypothetical protein